MNRNVKIIIEPDGKKLVLINDIRFKAKRREDWENVEIYLKEYVEEFSKNSKKKHEKDAKYG